MIDCRLDMAAVVCSSPGRHSDKVSNCMYTARLICARLEKCVMEITIKSGKTESKGCVCVKAVSMVTVREAAMPQPAQSYSRIGAM